MADTSSQSGNGEVAANLAEIGPDDFAKLIAGATDEQIAEGVNGPQRKQILDEIFGRMAEHVEPSQLGDTEAVVHFKILDRPEDQGGGYDHYEVAFKEGTCTVTDEPKQDPKVTIKVPAIEFLKLAANKASGPSLFMTGKLRLEGDLMLAARLTSFFRIPSAA
jgi:putative sterol carrier protein